MYYLFIKVFDVSYKDDVFMALQSVNVTRASYYEGYSLDKMLVDDIPVFKGFFISEEDRAKKVLLVTALIESKQQAKDFIEILEGAGLEVRKKDIVRVLVLPVELVFDRELGLVE